MLRETRKKSPRKESGSRWWKKMSLFSWKTLVPILLVSTLVWIVYGNSQFDVDIKDKVSKKRGLFSTLSTTRFKRLAGMTDRERFRELLTPIMVKRVSGSESIRNVQQHIVGVLKKLDWSIELDEFEADTPYGTKKFVNIVATQDPSKPRRLVLAAHYDSKFFANGEFIGATDSAVPCAMLLDLAESLQDELQNGHPEISLQLIFFDGEEAFKDWTPTDSIYGSRHLAQLMKERKQLKKMDAFILLDLIGAKRPVFRNFFASTSKLFERLVETEDKLGLHNLLASREGRYFSSSAPWGGGIEDDHIPFLHQGVPILHLISSPFPSVWHTTADDWSALDWPTIDNLTKVFRIFVAEYLHL